ncbi:uncharacterized protein LOC121062867 [Cygnus olor]|uniref:uncharacterized protein LOC121062867 n=1 Tax=Cygnus olor TaxID=8869 RepID=UPI001ADE1599|nr:uncharacterized protein LOC121062867 [Cygnus olor]
MLLLLADGIKIEPLNYVQLSRATSFPLHVVKNCVQETILLYCFLLRSKEHVPFAFRDIGVLTCEDGFLCMKFYLDCVKRLESTAGLVALLHSVSSDCEEKARGQSFHHLAGGSCRRAQDQKSVLPPCPGSSPGTKKADRQETAPRAKSTTTALPAPEASRRALQETEGGVPHTFPASYCLPCCHEPLHFDQGPWKRNKAFLGH